MLTAAGAGITGTGRTFTVTPGGDVVSQDVAVTVTSPCRTAMWSAATITP